MASSSILKKQRPLTSLIESQVVMNPKSKRGKSNALAFSLNLTALIDAFAILVIFLLSNYNGDAQNLDFSAKTQLPTASYSEILNMGTVVKIENGVFSVDEKKVTLETIVEKLIEAKKAKKDQADEIKNSLIIIADKDLDFNTLSPVIRAGGQAGFDSYKFAVMPGSKVAGK